MSLYPYSGDSGSLNITTTNKIWEIDPSLNQCHTPIFSDLPMVGNLNGACETLSYTFRSVEFGISARNFWLQMCFVSKILREKQVTKKKRRKGVSLFNVWLGSETCIVKCFNLLWKYFVQLLFEWFQRSGQWFEELPYQIKEIHEHVVSNYRLFLSRPKEWLECQHQPNAIAYPNPPVHSPLTDCEIFSNSADNPTKRRYSLSSSWFCWCTSCCCRSADHLRSMTIAFWLFTVWLVAVISSWKSRWITW